MDLIGVKISHSLGVGEDVAAHESVVGIRELWCGDSFMYLIPSTQSVNYERDGVLLLRFRLIMA